MSKYEIEIEGLPEGWELVNYALPKVGDYYIDSMEDIINGPVVADWGVQRRIIVRRKVRKYNLNKTLGDVLTLRVGHEEDGMRPLYKQDAHYKVKLAEVWQPNNHGKCPVDPEASIVRVMLADGTITERLADKLVWGKAFLKSTIVSWQFVRLADNVEW